VDAHPGGRGGAGDAQRVLERMQVPGLRVVQAAVVARAGHPAGHVGGRDAGEVGLVDLGHAVGPLHQLGALAGVGGHADVALAPFGVDPVLLQPGLQQFQCFQGHGPDAAGVVEPELVFDHRLVAGQSVDGLAAVAAAGTPAHLLGFQQRHLVSHAGQVQGGRQAGKTASHHGDITVGGAIQRGKRASRWAVAA
jgi:hypothetical protein